MSWGINIISRDFGTSYYTERETRRKGLFSYLLLSLIPIPNESLAVLMMNSVLNDREESLEHVSGVWRIPGSFPHEGALGVDTKCL